MSKNDKFTFIFVVALPLFLVLGGWAFFQIHDAYVGPPPPTRISKCYDNVLVQRYGSRAAFELEVPDKVFDESGIIA